MKDYNDRFDMMEELPVSEEMLGAYLEGTLSAPEAAYVSELVEEWPMLYELAEDDAYAPDFYADADGYADFPAEEYEALELPEPGGEPYDPHAEADIFDDPSPVYEIPLIEEESYPGELYPEPVYPEPYPEEPQAWEWPPMGILTEGDYPAEPSEIADATDSVEPEGQGYDDFDDFIGDI